MFRRTRALFTSLAILAVLVSLPVWLTYRAVRQERLDWALIAAIKNNNAQAVVSLLAQGADPNAKEHRPEKKRLWEPLLYLVWRRPLPLKPGRSALEIALEPRPNDNSDPPPLTKAVILEALINKGAFINFRYHGKYGTIETPLSKITWLIGFWTTPKEKPEYIKVAHLLLRKGAVPNPPTTFLPLASACNGGDSGLIKHLLDVGARINGDMGENQPLYEAVIFDNAPAMSLLLDRGAKSRIGEHPSRTLFQVALDWCAPACVKLLLDRGADANRKNSEGQTPLIQLCEWHGKVGWDREENRYQVARLLVEHGARLNAQDRNGKTALYYAETYYHSKVARLLKRAGAKE